MDLKDKTLFKEKAYINGQWVDADNKATFKILNPADGSEIANVADMGGAETGRAIEAANDALPEWRSLTAKSRSKILMNWYQLILENKDDLALMMTLEQGKPLTEAMGEVVYGASFVEWFSEEGKRVYGDVIPAHGADKKVVILKQPIGVIGAITPWNFPLAMITRKVAPALAVGCTAVIKPAEDTPLTALALAELAERAGFPKGVLNVIPCQKSNAPAVGSALCENPIVRKISFTGSTPVGKKLMAQCADQVKKVSLELGGNAPFIVFDDADIDAAVLGALASKYRNAGQTCICANRIFVQEGIYDVFAEKLSKAVQNFTVGNGLVEGVDQGPLINQAALNKVNGLVSDAVSKGAKTLIGGKPHESGGTFFEPTVLVDVTQDMDIATAEIFGPVAPLYKFKTEDEVIARANDTPFGLAAYFYSRDIGRVFRVSEGLEYGIVGVNEGIVSTEAAPFGGVKESGIGREGSKYGIDDFVEIKYLCMGALDK